ncbi:formate transporter FocA [Reinekea marinisedimentorum]|uniref:Formate transporter FocA n=1 Tax=Reinekea marinisedimentorum TaxID=230495 RepID=A0A4R3I4I9_9GAMM|nr:formate transporter FocA [Reinekea marinisedimentorum]TCS38889.1 formate transporter FocA [Reinekea marinisedimentorum]
MNSAQPTVVRRFTGMPPVEVPKPVKKSLTEEAGDYGKAKAEKSFAQSFGLAVFAGAFIAIAFVFYITVTTGAGHEASWGLVRLTGGIAFSLGLILVVIAGGELFTSTVLTSIAWAQQRISTGQMLGCWARVYAGNFVGAMLMLALVTGGKMFDLDAGAWGLNAIHIAHHKLQHTWLQAFSLGILCNLMVCLGVWMTFATKDVMAKTFLLILPVAMFVSSGFEHSIANMFMVPLGLSIKALASPEFFTSLGSSAHEFADLTIANFISKNLIPVTLGNIVGGGLFVGIGYWLVDKKPAAAAPVAVAPVTTHTSALKLVSNQPITAQPTNTEISGEKKIMNTAMKKATVRDLMIANAIVLSPDMTLVETLRIMAEQDVRVLPVADTQQRLLGVVSEHDVLRYLWSEEFSAASDWRIRDIMQTDVLTVEPGNSIVDLIEFMTVDREKLFPVNDSGFITANVYQSYEERLKTARAQRPSVYPVVHQDTLCGVIRRIDIIKHLASVVTEEGSEPAAVRRVSSELSKA